MSISDPVNRVTARKIYIVRDQQEAERKIEEWRKANPAVKNWMTKVVKHCEDKEVRIDYEVPQKEDS